LDELAELDAVVCDMDEVDNKRFEYLGEVVKAAMGVR
jgi:hypothetical protein